VKWALPVLAAGAVAVAGCGGGGGGTPLSKSEFIKRGDAICTKYGKKNRALPRTNPTNPSATDAQVKAAAPVLTQLADNVRSARSEFAKLNPPADVKSDWDNTLDDLDQIASKLDSASNAAREVDRQRVVDEYSEISRLSTRVSTFETGYGFTVCGTSG
jgi:hypothetical protein